MVRFDNSSGMTFADLASDLRCTETEAEARYEQWMTDENRRGWYGQPLAKWKPVGHTSEPLVDWERELIEFSKKGYRQECWPSHDR